MKPYPNIRELEHVSGITRDELTAREPRLVNLPWDARQAGAVRRRWSDVERVFAPIRSSLADLVGFTGRNHRDPILGSTAAYQVVYWKLYDAVAGLLPDHNSPETCPPNQPRMQALTRCIRMPIAASGESVSEPQDNSKTTTALSAHLPVSTKANARANTPQLTDRHRITAGNQARPRLRSRLRIDRTIGFWLGGFVLGIAGSILGVCLPYHNPVAVTISALWWGVYLGCLGASIGGILGAWSEDTSTKQQERSSSYS
jgi:hypothetical protein